MPYKIIFLGSPDFSTPTLEALSQDKRFEIVAVFSQPDKKIGRKQILTPSQVKQKALELGLKVYTPEKLNTPENIELIKKLNPDFLFTVAYGQIISSEILAIPKIEPINLHGSLLPKYRGASPIQSCLLNGDQKTGITFIRMIDKMDAGEMFHLEEIEIEKKDNAETLFHKIANLGAKITGDILTQIAQKKLTPLPQKEAKATYCKKITKENGKIDWQNETASQIHNKIRAYTPWPGCYTYFEGKIFKILEAKNLKKVPLEELVPPWREDTGDVLPHFSLKPGTVLKHNSQIIISTKSRYIQLVTIQLEGKKPMLINDFIKGKPEFLGSQLG